MDLSKPTSKRRTSTVTAEQQEQLRAMLAEFHERQQLTDAVYSTLSKALMKNILPQGARLSGASLAAVLGVSRTPIRDALRRLENERLIASTGGTGAVVVALSVEDIEEIYTLRGALEGCAASLAARHRTSADLALLETVERAFAEAVEAGDPDRISHLNVRFHDAVLQGAKSMRLVEFVVILQNSVRRLGPTTLASSQRARESVEEHAALVEAIRRGDSVLAERLAREHMEEARQERLKQFHHNFIATAGM